MTITAGPYGRTDLRTSTGLFGADRARALLGRQSSSVGVITAPGEPPAGFTSTSISVVSVDRPVVSFCLDRQSWSWPAVAVAGYVGIHLLAQDQEDVARGFALRGINGFARNQWVNGAYGVPLLTAPLSRMVCRITDRVLAGDNALVFAEPIAGDFVADQECELLHELGRYGTRS